MQIKSLKIRPIVSIVLLIMVIFFSQIGPAGGVPIVSTDKDIYNYGEMIKVNFSNSPGNDGDWICIVPVGSPDSEGGDFKYMPKALTQGSLIFAPPRRENTRQGPITTIAVMDTWCLAVMLSPW